MIIPIVVITLKFQLNNQFIDKKNSNQFFNCEIESKINSRSDNPRNHSNNMNKIWIITSRYSVTRESNLDSSSPNLRTSKIHDKIQENKEKRVWIKGRTHWIFMICSHTSIESLLEPQFHTSSMFSHVQKMRKKSFLLMQSHYWYYQKKLS